MKKAFYFTILFLFIFLSCSLVYCILRKEGESVTEFLGFEKSKGRDLINHAQQYELLYTLSLRNSLQAECDWDQVSFSWAFPKKTEYPIYQSAIKYIDLEEKDPDTKIEKFTTPKQAVEGFFDTYPLAKKHLSYDYVPMVHSDVAMTSEKMPVFTREQSIRIFTSTIGIWRDSEEMYVAGLYEPVNRFKTFLVNKDEPYFSVSLLKENAIKTAVASGKMKFLNHQFLCENEDISKISLSEIEAVYIHKDNYLLPVYKINGMFTIKEEVIFWSALINGVDYSKLDYTIYENTKTDQSFIPKPYITEIMLENDTYTISGFLPNKREDILTGTLKATQNVTIDFATTDATGEYNSGERKETLEKEIMKSLQVEKGGAFSFSFSHNNFWKVEKMLYEDDEGNPLETPTHSSEKEMKRPSYDNHFSFQVCSIFEESSYCTRESETYTLLKN